MGNYYSYTLTGSTSIKDKKVLFISPRQGEKSFTNSNGTIYYIDTKYDSKYMIKVKLDQYFRLKINDILIDDLYCLTKVNNSIKLSKLNAGPMDTNKNQFESNAPNELKYNIRAIQDRNDSKIYIINVDIKNT